ncbi:type II toxin-antitoxin system RelE family toxin [Desulfosporosinus youngiae]|uniref:Cytotoxic translational repressor of toxin-antitoxin stability system n=1 Tax=Desulfosporosinus youngiae DSM 17734 TaxID=768710 RepID=H5XZE0_9FIRM|nr:type II toxin-antitoxin system RelE/ParE family toxin [Desulfosporosinus youngiae]EHQ91846.1 cytotoxic translational repressor of toxin-antitoxin stability system [Desulfosporosinus youngiae DSM 17734]
MNIVITTRAKKDLEKLDKATRNRVYLALEHFVAGQRVDIKKLRGSENYRIRVGECRVIIDISKQTVTVYTFRVLHSKEAYDK